MNHHHSSRPADEHTTEAPHTRTTEIYEAAFSTTGNHPQAGVALTRTIEQARQRLADMLIFCDPHAPRHRRGPYLGDRPVITRFAACGSVRSTWLWLRERN